MSASDLSRILLLVLLSPSLTLPTAGAGREASDPAEVLLLGVFHFDNPGRDVVQARVTDVLTEANQA